MQKEMRKKIQLTTFFIKISQLINNVKHVSAVNAHLVVTIGELEM